MVGLGSAVDLTSPAGFWVHYNIVNAVLACEIKLIHNYFSLRRRPTEIFLFQRVETCLELFPF